DAPGRSALPPPRRAPRHEHGHFTLARAEVGTGFSLPPPRRNSVRAEQRLSTGLVRRREALPVDDRPRQPAVRLEGVVGDLASPRETEFFVERSSTAV